MQAGGEPIRVCIRDIMRADAGPAPWPDAGQAASASSAAATLALSAALPLA